jgi:hypothetical protein
MTSSSILDSPAVLLRVQPGGRVDARELKAGMMKRGKAELRTVPGRPTPTVHTLMHARTTNNAPNESDHSTPGSAARQCGYL